MSRPPSNRRTEIPSKVPNPMNPSNPGLGFWVLGLGFRVSSSGAFQNGLGFGFRVYALGTFHISLIGFTRIIFRGFFSEGFKGHPN